VRPFRVAVPEDVLDDLRARLKRTRWPAELPASAGQTSVALVRDLADYWREGFSWRAAEERFNAFPQFTAAVGDTILHFLHVRGTGPSPLPLVLTHGWPGSVAEFLDVIPALTHPASAGGDPADAFDVVVPSLPGFGFSSTSAAGGMNLWRIGDLWAGLMAALGYRRFGAHGGDFGAGVSTVLGLRHPERMVGIHLNYIPGSYRPPPGPDLDGEESRFQAEVSRWRDEHGAYAHLQATTPLTPSFALNDSPAGLLAWIVEKFEAWGDCDEDVVARFGRDTLLTNVTLYWVTGTIATANRLYWETRRAPLHFAPGEKVHVPVGVARFPREAPFPPRRWVERGYNLTRWTELPRGGHFAALEEPAALVEDLREFFRPLRQARGEGVRGP
jgi:pimeloyl-ACP methyl ester carboxylesterase